MAVVVAGLRKVTDITTMTTTAPDGLDVVSKNPTAVTRKTFAKPKENAIARFVEPIEGSVEIKDRQKNVGVVEPTSVFAEPIIGARGDAAGEASSTFLSYVYLKKAFPEKAFLICPEPFKTGFETPAISSPWEICKGFIAPKSGRIP